MSKRLVCICNMVTEKEILETIKKGAQSISDVQQITHAGASCGRCQLLVNALVDELLTNLPDDPQQKIIFGEVK